MLEDNSNDNTQDSSISTLATTVDSISPLLLPPPNKKNKNSSIPQYVNSKKKGLSTNLSPEFSFEPKHDKVSLFKANEYTPHEQTVVNDKSIILTMPSKSKFSSHQWKYFHFVSYNKEFGERPGSHKPGEEYACCNICGQMMIFKKLAKNGKIRSTGSFMLSHLQAHKVYPVRSYVLLHT